MAGELKRLTAAVMAAFGKTITYTPADLSVSEFSCSADFNIERELLDEFKANAAADRCKCRIEHASFTSHGLSGPVVRQERKIGDTITKQDFNGNEEVWDIVGKEPEDGGTWLLTLERNVRLGL
ncbi:MAG: hypothetical protein LLG06_05900 [Desulfobacteraceae bacterium]|nr:hypothetical protein [Desulfobacteraceae bacterium]